MYWKAIYTCRTICEIAMYICHRIKISRFEKASAIRNTLDWALVVGLHKARPVQNQWWSDEVFKDPYLLLLVYWLLMGSEWGRIVVFGSEFTTEPLRFQQMASYSLFHKWSSLYSMGLKAKWIAMNVRKKSFLKTKGDWGSQMMESCGDDSVQDALYLCMKLSKNKFNNLFKND